MYIIKKTTKCSIWLIPCDEHKKILSKQVREIALELNSSKFEPHLTIYSGEAKSHSIRLAINQIATNFPEIHLKALSIRTGEIFTKTLFISFETTKELASMSNSFIKHYTTQSFSLIPHLSLAYKNLSRQKRLMLSNETKLILNEVRFSGIRAVATPTQTKTENDIKRWESIYFKSLTHLFEFQGKTA
ncbi:MAG: hypothetical protein PF690_14270 [Deltaproteobacteria bacterium]|jgi:hypothetical protein|nr:hypothetical protein [Deltaproteobacteria bacterium]